MIKLVLNEEEYNLPTHLGEVNIETYNMINEVVNKETDLIERMIKLISVMTGIAVDDIKKIDIEQIKIINHTMEFMFKKQDYKLQETFKIDGKLYGLNKDLGKISFGEYIDLESFSNGKKSLSDLHILMAILYRPVIEWDKHKVFNWIFKGIKKRSPEYKIEKYIDNEVLDRANIFKHKLTMDIVWGSMFFFIILKVMYTLSLKGFTEQQMMETLEKILITGKIPTNI